MQKNIEKKRLSLKDGQEGLEAVYREYSVQIKKFLIVRINSQEIAEDLTGDIFVKLSFYLQTGKEIQDVRAFLYRLAKNRLIDFYRTKKEEVSFETWTGDIAETVSLEEKIDTATLSHQVKEGMKKLRKEYAEILDLRYLQQFEIEEIAGILKKSEGAVRVLLHRATNALREITQQD